VIAKYIDIFRIHVFKDEKTALVARATFRGWILFEV
jgi:hypothetical protein